MENNVDIDIFVFSIWCWGKLPKNCWEEFLFFISSKCTHYCYFTPVIRNTGTSLLSPSLKLFNWPRCYFGTFRIYFWIAKFHMQFIKGHWGSIAFIDNLTISVRWKLLIYILMRMFCFINFFQNVSFMLRPEQFLISNFSTTNS